jgi:hypothetical protein
MSFNELINGVNGGFVSTHGQNPAHFPFPHLSHTSVTNHKTTTQKLGTTGLR